MTGPLTSSAHGGHKVRDAAVSLAPQLWPSAPVMAQRVVNVGKLVQHPAHALCLYRPALLSIHLAELA